MKYKVNNEFVTKILNNKLSIFDSENSMLYRFNETATFIFKKIKSGLDKQAVIMELIKKYDAKKDEAEKDFDELIKDLRTKKIITSL
jgi:hypothetical protein